MAKTDVLTKENGLTIMYLYRCKKE